MTMLARADHNLIQIASRQHEFTRKQIHRKEKTLSPASGDVRLLLRKICFRGKGPSERTEWKTQNLCLAAHKHTRT
jgi:hypothetical protein